VSDVARPHAVTTTWITGAIRCASCGKSWEQPHYTSGEWLVCPQCLHAAPTPQGATRAGRILVLAETSKIAIEWCQENGIPPRGPRTAILGPSTGRGMMLRPEDRVIFVGAVEQRRDYERVVAALTPALLNVGGLDKIEHVEWGEQ
jgi:hypothetical protein